MGKVDPQDMMDRMRAGLERDEADGKLAGLTVADLQDAMSHPRAAAVIAECSAADERSVKQGEPAPDFTLPWLPGSAGSEAATLTLSSRFGKRPVALVFGSYT